MERDPDVGASAGRPEHLQRRAVGVDRLIEAGGALLAHAEVLVRRERQVALAEQRGKPGAGDARYAFRVFPKHQATSLPRPRTPVSPTITCHALHPATRQSLRSYCLHPVPVYTAVQPSLSHMAAEHLLRDQVTFARSSSRAFAAQRRPNLGPGGAAA
jgi:hypothetical protein